MWTHNKTTPNDERIPHLIMNKTTQDGNVNLTSLGLTHRST